MRIRIRKYSFHVILTAVFLLFAASSFAAPTPGDQPGAQASRFQVESEQARDAVAKKKVKKPEIDMREEPAPTEQPAGRAFVLTGVVIEGSSIFRAEDMEGAYKGYVGKDVTFKDLEDIARNIKAMYAKKGYLTTTVYLPEQNIEGGKVTINIAEGLMGNVEVEGNKWFSSAWLKKYIHSKKNELLNIFTLQRDLLRLNQYSDLEVRSVVSPGKDPGTTDITLKITDKLPYHAGTTYDNLGTRLVGKDRTALSFRSSNLTGLGDTAFFNFLMSANSSGDFASYAIPLDTYGTKFIFDFTAFDMKLGKEYKALDITGHTQIYTPHISGEIYLSEDFQANVDCGLDIKSIKKMSKGYVTTNDQLRIPYVSFDMAKTDSIFGGGQTSFSPRFSFGTSEFLGASKYNHSTSSRPYTGGFYFKYEHTIRRVQRMFFDSYISARSLFQTASATLPSSEQFQIGGMNTVRGYPEGEYLADIGATLNVDWVFPCYIIPKEIKLPYATMPLRDQLQPVLFMDMGGGKLKKTASGEEPIAFLMGVGGGLKFQFNKNLFMTLEWAERIGDRPTPGQGPSNFYVTIQCEV